MYARVTAKKISQKDFKGWSDNASHERDRIIATYGSTPSIDIIASFKKYLGNR